MQEQTELTTPHIDAILTAVATPEGVKLDKIRRLLSDIRYLRVYRRVEHLASLGVLRVERAGRELVVYSTEGEHD